MSHGGSAFSAVLPLAFCGAASVGLCLAAMRRPLRRLVHRIIMKFVMPAEMGEFTTAQVCDAPACQHAQCFFKTNNMFLRFLFLPPFLCTCARASALAGL